MVKQERAVRTRSALVRAAAAEFDRDGYHGTSLARISKVAKISIGAVTFHFPSKNELADAVFEEGRAMTVAALEQMAAEPVPALRAVVDLSLELTRLMEEETAVRSAIRLSRERPGSASWSDLWLPTVRRLLDRAYENGQLRDDALPADVTALVEHLLGGAEAYLRLRLATEIAYESAVGQLKRLWHLALVGVSADGSTGVTTAVPQPRPSD
ncbi:TetR/AcrR family transcriptional regulator [Streptomyces antarcticus]|uniref:TetR/AcrR family transcriptional regulator n=1 Tax=Streptomyces antarcticus TaxID=2996458 RepID=UPI00226EF7C7|nr:MULTISPECIES: TetR/AcrR family transcriptional regulator [unclassified Streptomyces]MCY0942897.1 TetR/AcrR family transcriptional regulator [Streptomyces sp. H34-AA3]MCY0953056.1 TetR/AcrR family transcriptional regulator [Streptomyces sp. H27-S2]MCZ4083143.1 TetR/AcrR family transcriptional regulator [Streptomyces sp. H34-S5]